MFPLVSVRGAARVPSRLRADIRSLWVVVTLVRNLLGSGRCVDRRDDTR